MLVSDVSIAIMKRLVAINSKTAQNNPRAFTYAYGNSGLFSLTSSSERICDTSR